MELPLIKGVSERVIIISRRFKRESYISGKAAASFAFPRWSCSDIKQTKHSVIS